MNVVFSWSTGSIIIWLWSEKTSIKLNTLFSVDASTSLSMDEVENCQNTKFPVASFTIITFNNQSGYWTSRIKSTLKSLSVSCFTTFTRFEALFLFFCFTSLAVGLTLREWLIIKGKYLASLLSTRKTHLNYFSRIVPLPPFDFGP